MTSPAFSLLAIHLSFQGRAVLDGIEFNLPAGARASLSGPSGSGKTTLLRVVAGLESPDKGTVEIAGKIGTLDSKVLIPPWERGVGMVFQDLGLWPSRTVAQHVTDPLRARGLSKEDAGNRAGELLESLGLASLADRLPGRLSGGEARRLGLARALAPRPALLLLDEPFAGMDPASRKRGLGFLEEILQEASASVLLVTHHPEEAGALGGRVHILEGGKLLS